VCLADLPPSAPSKTRYLVRKLRAALPDLPIIVGRWAPVSLADESSEVLRAAGATVVTSSLLETRTYLHGIADSRPPLPEAQGAFDVQVHMADANRS
jgi:hypothetical protein